MHASSVVLILLLLGVTVLGFWAAHWREKGALETMDDWALGGRNFGVIVSWFLIGGDLYTAYTFIAVPALVYGVGAFAFFAGILMWGEYQTRHLVRKDPQEAEATARVYSLNQAAKDGRTKEPVRHPEPATIDRTVRQIG